MQAEATKVLRGAALVFVLALTLACATGPDARLCFEAGDHAADRPLELTVELSQSQVAIGQRVSVTYHLKNASDGSVTACPVGLNEFHLINNVTKANRGLVITSTGISLADMIRVPAHGIVTWTGDIEVPDVGTGEATFLGLFDIGVTRIKSKPVTIDVLPRGGQSG